MSRLRPECRSSMEAQAFPTRAGALRAILKAVAKRRSLAYGVLDNDENGKHCAMGCFWADNPEVSISTALVDEVAAVNDAVPADADAKTRWDTVMNWLRMQLGETV